MPKRPPFPASSPKSAPSLTDEDYYMMPDGFLVFTAIYHRKRGYCCKNGCRHCPFGYKKTRE